MRVIQAGVAYFGLVFAAGFLLGTVRVVVLVPHLGVRVAELLEMPLLFVVILLAARLVVRRFALPRASLVRLRVGVLALGLMLVAELSLASALRGQSPGQWLAGRDPVSGSVYLAMLGVFAAMPPFISPDP
jgi:hypothetical protein